MQTFSEQSHGEYKGNGIASTQNARQGKSATDLILDMLVRRLTPLECERLQGFPDGWTDIGTYHNSNGKLCQASDSARYKALGNSHRVAIVEVGAWPPVLPGMTALQRWQACLTGSVGSAIWEKSTGRDRACGQARSRNFGCSDKAEVWR